MTTLKPQPSRTEIVSSLLRETHKDEGAIFFTTSDRAVERLWRLAYQQGASNERKLTEAITNTGD